MLAISPSDTGNSPGLAALAGGVGIASATGPPPPPQPGRLKYPSVASMVRRAVLRSERLDMSGWFSRLRRSWRIYPNSRPLSRTGARGVNVHLPTPAPQHCRRARPSSLPLQYSHPRSDQVINDPQQFCDSIREQLEAVPVRHRRFPKAETRIDPQIVAASASRDLILGDILSMASINAVRIRVRLPARCRAPRGRHAWSDGRGETS